MDTHQPLQGRLEDVHFSELLLTIFQRKESGVLHVVRHKIEKEVYFQSGRIVFAKSNDPDERLGELCLRTGKISYRHLDECSKKVVPGLRLGTILVQEGYLRASDLYQGVIHQVEEIVYSLFDWSDGTYEFRSGELPTKEVITLSISTPDIILTGISRVWRWTWIREWVGPLDTIYVRRDDWEKSAKKMSITPDLQSIIDMLDRPRNLEEILNTSSLSNFETCKILWALLIIGIIQPGMTTSGTLQMPFAPEITSDIFTIEGNKVESVPWRVDDTPPYARPAIHHEIVTEKTVRQVQQDSPDQPAVAATLDSSGSEPVSPSNTAEFKLETEQSLFVSEPENSELKESGTNEIPIPGSFQDQEPVQVEPSIAPAFLVENNLSVAPVEISFSDLAETPQKPAEPSRTPSSELSDRWEQNIASDVNNFNEVHRFLFEMLRMELGSSVMNFLARILNKASAQYPLVFDGVKMNEFGELDRNSLESNIQGNLADRYSEAFRFLLDEERKMMQTYLDRKRAEAIAGGLNRVLEKHKLPF